MELFIKSIARAYDEPFRSKNLPLALIATSVVAVMFLFFGFLLAHAFMDSDSHTWFDMVLGGFFILGFFNGVLSLGAVFTLALQFPYEKYSK